MTADQIAAWGGIAGALIALLWIAFDDAREVNASLNDGADEGADWGAEQSHFGGDR